MNEKQSVAMQTLPDTDTALSWAFYDLIKCIIRIYEAHEDELNREQSGTDANN